MGRAGTSVNMMYRSVPPRPLSYTFSDEVLRASLEPRTPAGGGGGGAKRVRSKTAPVTINTAEEYAERFHSRPTTRPSVIDFNGCGVKMYTGTVGRRRALNHSGQFPAVKSRNVPAISLRPKSPVPKLVPEPTTERGTAATSSLHLAPLAKGTEPNSALSLQTKPYRPPPSLPVHAATPKLSKTLDHSRLHAGRSATSSVKSRGKSSGCAQDRHHGGDRSLSGVSPQHLHTAKSFAEGQLEDLDSSKLSTWDTVAFTVSPHVPAEHVTFPDVLTQSEDLNDLSELPRPKRILPRRDLPWVFRFKVKKEMNALSKIMASKPNAGNSVTPAGSTL